MLIFNSFSALRAITSLLGPSYSKIMMTVCSIKQPYVNNAIHCLLSIPNKSLRVYNFRSWLVC